MPNLRAKRRTDRAVRAVDMEVTVLGVYFLNPGASPQRGGRLQCVGARSGRHYLPQGIQLGGAKG
jgi:hypothetical protein